MNNSILIDSSFLAALYNPADPKHRLATIFINGDHSTRLIPEVVLPEVTFVLGRAGGLPAVARFLDALVATKPILQTLMVDDLIRAKTVMLTYPKAEFDLVDCCIMALAERLNVQHVATFDRRDFSMFRPTHCNYLHLLP